MTMVAFLEPLTRVISHRHERGLQVCVLANSGLLKAEKMKCKLHWEDCLKADVQQMIPMEIRNECRNTKPLKTHFTAKYAPR